MKIVVIYYSKTGNTRKIAEVIAKELAAELKSVEETVSFENYDLICVGTPVYAGCACGKIKEFLNDMPNLKGKKTAAFCTTAGTGVKSTLDFVKNKFEQKEAIFLKGFSCIGRSGIFFGFGPKLWAAAHPDKDDIAKARIFARSLIDKQ